MLQIEVFDLASLARSFATRMKGKEASLLVGEVIVSKKPAIMVVDWNGISAASPSFVDEFVGGVREAMGKGSCCTRMVFTGENSDLIDMVDTILRRNEFPVQHAASPADVEGDLSSASADPPRPRMVAA